MGRQQEHQATTKMANLMAHLQVLGESKNRENELLGVLVANRVKAEKELNSVNGKIKKAERAIADEHRRIEEEYKDIEKIKKAYSEYSDSLSLKEDNFNNEKKVFLEYKKSELEELERIKTESYDEIKRLESDIKRLKKVQGDTEKDVQATISELNAKIAHLHKEEKEANTGVVATQDMLSEAQNELLSVLNKKDEATYLLDKTVASTADRLKNIEEREDAVRVREEDCAVIARRLKKRYLEETGINVKI